MNRNSFRIGSLFLILMIPALLLVACGRGRVSEKTPIHPNPNMDQQPKYKAQSESRFFADGSAMRPLVEGTVARGRLRDDVRFYTGKNSRGEFLKKAPVEITMKRIKRGQERFDIFCSPCHGRAGDGQSIMIKKEYVTPPDFHTDSIRQFTDGRIFDAITNGVRNMPSYKHQIPTDDRWSIILYLRALQRSHKATLEDIPAAIRKEFR